MFTNRQAARADSRPNSTTGALHVDLPGSNRTCCFLAPTFCKRSLLLSRTTLMWIAL